MCLVQRGFGVWSEDGVYGGFVYRSKNKGAYCTEINPWGPRANFLQELRFGYKLRLFLGRVLRLVLVRGPSAVLGQAVGGLALRPQVHAAAERQQFRCVVQRIWRRSEVEYTYQYRLLVPMISLAAHISSNTKKQKRKVLIET